jgi:hypothetical protein
MKCVMRIIGWVSMVAVATVLADGPADNVVEKVRPIPPPGVTVPEEIRRELTEGAASLGRELEALSGELAKQPGLRARWADAAIFQKGVDWALRYNEFFRTNEFTVAREHLRLGRERVEALRSGLVPWNGSNGLVVRGYVSRIDGSIQPYGLVIPKSWRPDSGRRWRLDCWFHGRGEQLSELSFIQDRLRNPGEFTPPDTFVLHLYGRYCNGSRFAGEADFWEALEEVQRLYPIDDDRILVRGFSLGGASCWHFAVHHAWRWAAAAPGAGFSETAEFLNVFQNEKLQPFPWEQKLWALHDATANALNLRMVPTVAYSGGDDRQIQAALAVERSMESLGLKLTHLVGPKTGHKYEPETKAELNRRMDALAAKGRVRTPREVFFTTPSLRYPRMAWFIADGLGQHWEPATVWARIEGEQSGIGVQVGATNVSAFRLEFGPGEAPFDPGRPVVVRISSKIGNRDTGNTLTLGRVGSDGSFSGAAHWDGKSWVAGAASVEGLVKRHGLQGPIDDAFMERFVMVTPTGDPMHAAVGAWVKSESARAVEQWRRHYRGDALVREDGAVTEEDIGEANLVLWGDPGSNRLLAKLADRLPVKWTAAGLEVNGATYPADSHVPVLVFPNPLNPKRYVVLNSGFTFREYDYLNNARQTPKLPDWAVVDVRQAPNARFPGKIVAGGFFGERWEWK